MVSHTLKSAKIRCTKSSRLYKVADLVASRKNYGGKTVLILYGGPGETHEVAFTGAKKSTVTEGCGVQSQEKNGSLVLNWAVTPARKVVNIDGNLTVYLLSMSH